MGAPAIPANVACRERALSERRGRVPTSLVVSVRGDTAMTALARVDGRALANADLDVETSRVATRQPARPS